MYQSFRIFTLFASFLALAATAARASTYGDNLLGIGTSARALGGTGVAAPQDVTGALTSNPATLSFLAPTVTTTEFSATAFLPHVSARVGALQAESASKTYVIPSLAVSGRISERDKSWSYGLVAYGVSGLGVDYRRTALDTTLAPTPYPLVAGTRTELQILEVAPSASYRFSSAWSAGAALHFDYGRLDLGGGAKGGVGVGVLPGLVFRPGERVTLGLAYISPVPINYRGVTDFDGDGAVDNLKLASPQEVKLGSGLELIRRRLLLAADLKWVNWSGARGYRDFDWRDTWVLALGVQFHAIPDRLTLRAGFSQNGNPVRAHQGWNGTGAPANATNVQGKWVNNYYYETFRIVGFPAIVERHASLGATIRLGQHSVLDLGYTHAFKNRITESGTNLVGAPVTISSALSENSFELGFSRRL